MLLLLPNATILNTDSIAYVVGYGSYCSAYLNFSVMAGLNNRSMPAELHIPMTLTDFYVLWNKELALVKAMENAANPNS